MTGKAQPAGLPFSIRELSPLPVTMIADFWRENWGGDFVVTRGRQITADAVRAIAAEDGGELVGLLTYQVLEGELEITSLDSLKPGQGIGSALLEAARTAAVAAGCRRVFLITTNDNLHALGFYQRQGYRIAAVYPGALDKTRRLKPAVPAVAANGIPIRDEIELERPL